MGRYGENLFKLCTNGHVILNYLKEIVYPNIPNEMWDRDLWF